MAVNIEDRDQFKRISRALAQVNILITHDYNKQSAKEYGVQGIPHLVIVGKDGKVIKIHRGYNERMIDSILAEINMALTVNDQSDKSALTVLPLPASPTTLAKP